MPEQNRNPYVCPKCGQNGAISNIVPLMSDVRYDNVGCMCGTQWRVYYKFVEPSIEVVYVPADEDKDAAETQGE